MCVETRSFNRARQAREQSPNTYLLILKIKNCTVIFLRKRFALTTVKFKINSNRRLKPKLCSDAFKNFRRETIETRTIFIAPFHRCNRHAAFVIQLFLLFNYESRPRIYPSLTSCYYFSGAFEELFIPNGGMGLWCTNEVRSGADLSASFAPVKYALLKFVSNDKPPCSPTIKLCSFVQSTKLCKYTD